MGRLTLRTRLARGFVRHFFEGCPRDLRRAARRLVAAPLFTLFAVLSLAMGVGITTAVYSVIDSIFLRELGIREPERLVFVVTPYDGRFLKGSISQPDFQDLRAAQKSFSTVSASASFTPAVAASSTTVRLAAEAVDGAYFSTLGVTVAMGRAIQPDDEAAGARVVVLSHRLWRARFASDAKTVGQTIRLSGHPFEVIGVAASSFEGATGALPGTGLFIPLGAEETLAASSSSDRATSPRDRRRLLVFGRLKPSVTVAAASAELTGIAASLDTTFPSGTNAKAPGQTERPWKAKSIAAITEEDNALRRFGITLVALVALVLVVACTNLANLVLARGTARQQEFTVRWALGASRWRLVREQCAESLLLAIAGAGAAYVVFHGLRLLMDAEINVALPMGGYWTMVIRPALNVTALGMAVASLLISLVVFGLEPALQLTRSHDLRGKLAAVAVGAGNPRAKRQQTLLRWQVAVSAGFFVIATMFVKYTLEESRHDSGVELERLGVAVLDLRTDRWDEASARRVLDRVLEEAERDPAVEVASVSTGLPFGTDVIRLTLSLPDKPAVSNADYVNATGIGATPSIFRTIGVPIRRGRGFDDGDHSGARPVVVLSEFTAHRIFGAIDAVGRQLVVQTQTRRATATVIGVAAERMSGSSSLNPGRSSICLSRSVTSHS